MYPKSAGPRYIQYAKNLFNFSYGFTDGCVPSVVAMSVNCVTAFVAIVAATVLRFTLVSLNRKLDRGELVEGAVAVGEAVPGEAARKGFRFVL